MTVWFALALMTAVAIFAVLWPLHRRGRRASRGAQHGAGRLGELAPPCGGDCRARPAAARRRGALSRARLALLAGPAAQDPPCGRQPEPIDREPDCAGRGPP